MPALSPGKLLPLQITPLLEIYCGTGHLLDITQTWKSIVVTGRLLNITLFLTVRCPCIHTVRSLRTHTMRCPRTHTVRFLCAHTVRYSRIPRSLAEFLEGIKPLGFPLGFITLLSSFPPNLPASGKNLLCYKYYPQSHRVPCMSACIYLYF